MKVSRFQDVLLVIVETTERTDFALKGVLNNLKNCRCNWGPEHSLLSTSKSSIPYFRYIFVELWISTIWKKMVQLK